MADTDIAVTSLAAAGGPGTITYELGYTGATSPLPYLQLDHFEWWIASVNDRSTAIHITDTTDRRYALPSLIGATTRYAWARPVDTSGNLGDFYPLSPTAGVAGTSRLITVDDLGDTLTAMNSFFGLSLRDINERDMLTSAMGADQDIGNWGDKQFVLNQMRVSVKNATKTISAGYTQAILLLADETEGALADVVQGIDSQFGTTTSGVTVRMTSFAGPGGGWARYGWQLRTDGGTWPATASSYWEVKSDGTSRRVDIASEHNFMDDAGNILATFAAGGASFNNAYIVNLDATNVSADSLTVSRLEIAARGLSFEDIAFEHNVATVGATSATYNTAAWTAGTVNYVNDAGTSTTAAISAGSVAWTTGTQYIYWVKGATTFSSTATLATARAKGNVVVATYRGGKKLVVTFGKLIIDADSTGVKFNSLATDRVADNAIIDIVEDTSLTSPGAWSAASIPSRPGGASLGAYKTEIGSLNVTIPASPQNFAIPIGCFLYWTVGAPSIAYVYTAYMSVTIGGTEIVLDWVDFGSLSASTVRKIMLSTVMPMPVGGPYTVKVYIATSGPNTLPLPVINSSSTFNGMIPKK